MRHLLKPLLEDLGAGCSLEYENSDRIPSHLTLKLCFCNCRLRILRHIFSKPWCLCCKQPLDRRHATCAMTLVLLRQGTLLLLHQLISTASIQTPGSEVPWLNSPILQSCITWVLPIDSHCQRQVSSLLEEYSDHLVGDICFQLRFEISDLDSTDSCNSKLPLLLAAVVQHASATLRLSGRVGALFQFVHFL